MTEGGENSNEPLIVLNKKNKYDKKFLEEINQKRMELISNIVYRVLSGKLGLWYKGKFEALSDIVSDKPNALITCWVQITCKKGRNMKILNIDTLEFGIDVINYDNKFSCFLEKMSELKEKSQEKYKEQILKINIEHFCCELMMTCISYKSMINIKLFYRIFNIREMIWIIKGDK